MKRVLFLLVFLLACSQTASPAVKQGCTAESRQVDVCPASYEKVCGWYSEAVQCFAFPCAEDFSNSCEACKNLNVNWWSPGECPAQ